MDDREDANKRMLKPLPYFDPNFDDATWTDNWSVAETVRFPDITHPSNYRIDSITLSFAMVFGRTFRLSCPLRCNRLIDPQGTVWMSDTPQERMMMYNNAARSKGHALVGGLGLGSYIKYAQMGSIGRVERFTIVERDEAVVEMVLPIAEKEIDVPFEITVDSIESFLERQVIETYDTIFIDTWHRLDAIQLPRINSIRDMASVHVEEKGVILLWGYHWMLHLFEHACRHILEMPSANRWSWLLCQQGIDPKAIDLLRPIVSHFAGIKVESLDGALKWCMDYIVDTSDAND